LARAHFPPNGGREGLQDYAKARQYHERIAALDIAPKPKGDDARQTALNALGHIHREGLGTPIDHAQAARYFAQALQCDSNNACALAELGWLYLHGWGVEKNPALAKHHLLQLEHAVLTNGVDYGFQYLAHIYATGKIVERDLERAACYQGSVLRQPLSEGGRVEIRGCMPKRLVRTHFPRLESEAPE